MSNENTLLSARSRTHIPRPKCQNTPTAQCNCKSIALIHSTLPCRRWQGARPPWRSAATASPSSPSPTRPSTPSPSTVPHSPHHPPPRKSPLLSVFLFLLFSPSFPLGRIRPGFRRPMRADPCCIHCESAGFLEILWEILAKFYIPSRRLEHRSLYVAAHSELFNLMCSGAFSFFQLSRVSGISYKLICIPFCNVAMERILLLNKPAAWFRFSFSKAVTLLAKYEYHWSTTWSSSRIVYYTIVMSMELELSCALTLFFLQQLSFYLTLNHA